jgi:hypothetical protein
MQYDVKVEFLFIKTLSSSGLRPVTSCDVTALKTDARSFCIKSTKRVILSSSNQSSSIIRQSDDPIISAARNVVRDVRVVATGIQLDNKAATHRPAIKLECSLPATSEPAMS